MILVIRFLKKTNKESCINNRDSASNGYTLIEVLIAISIFSIATGLVFVIFSQSSTVKKVGRGYMEAVFLTDSFLLERRSKKDSINYFFSVDNQNAIKQGNVDFIRNITTSTQRHSMKKDGLEYIMFCYPQIISVQPFYYRAFVDCIWKIKDKGVERKMIYSLSTVFVHELHSTKVKDANR